MYAGLLMLMAERLEAAQDSTCQVVRGGREGGRVLCLAPSLLPGPLSQSSEGVSLPPFSLPRALPPSYLLSLGGPCPDSQNMVGWVCLGSKKFMYH